ncbi:MAG: hypothetical protein M1813_002095 [Trichoglossum hirsutum]|nr:MAG: hypothetical protein M1813_002095 [Trichoglossum hirsutum]
MRPTTILAFLSATLSVVSAHGLHHRHAYRSAKIGNIKAPSPSTTSVTTSPTPSGNDSPSSDPPSSGKRGLAFNDPGLTKGFGGTGSQVTWGYNWYKACSDTIGSGPGVEFVAMLWGNGGDRTNGWTDAANTAISKGGKHLLAFNEPDHPEQANIDPTTAAKDYKTYMNPFAGKARLGAPAVTNGGGNMGLTWLKSFMGACGTECSIDFVPIHWYDSASNVEYFKKHIQDAHNATGKPIWITEFASTGLPGQQKTFLETVLPWLDDQPFVERYSYFGVFEGVMVNGNQPNDVGSTFNTFTGH